MKIVVIYLSAAELYFLCRVILRRDLVGFFLLRMQENCTICRLGRTDFGEAKKPGRSLFFCPSAVRGVIAGRSDDRTSSCAGRNRRWRKKKTKEKCRYRSRKINKNNFFPFRLLSRRNVICWQRLNVGYHVIKSSTFAAWFMAPFFIFLLLRWYFFHREHGSR